MTYALLIGGAGFIGSHLCDTLIHKSKPVICIDNLHLGSKKNIAHLLPHPNFKFIKCDVNDLNTFDSIIANHDIDIVYHLAANSDIQAGAQNIDIDFSLTLNTTLNILRIMKQHQIHQLVFASSSAVYGSLNEPLSETTGPLLPISFYGASKLASEGFISSYTEQFPLKAWIIRFPNVIGERLTHGVVFDFIKKLKMNPNKLEILGNGHQTKPYIYVKDLISGMLHFQDHANGAHQIVNLGVSSSTSVNDIADIIIKAMGLRNVEKVYTGGQKGWIGDVPKFQYDLTKIHSLGWTASLSSNEAITKTVAHELNQHD